MANDPENQPRYQLEGEADVKILSEEQSRGIQKLLANAGHVLTGEERELILKLVEKLDQETARVQNLRKMTVADKSLETFLVESKPSSGKSLLGARKNSSPSTEPEADAEADSPEAEPQEAQDEVVRHVIGFRPEEVVQRYIECWNQQKFRAEFECFSRDFMVIPMDQYVEARQNSYQQELQRGGQRIDFTGIESSEVTGNEAEIVATKSVTQGNKQSKTERERYRLTLEKGHWVISSVEPL